MITFKVEGKPRGKGRPRFTKTGHAYTDEKTQLYESLVKIRARERMRGKLPIKEEVSIVIIARYAIPQRDSKKLRERKIDKEIRPTVKPDIDNVVKAILDGMNGIVYSDDKQVTMLSAIKEYSEEPCVMVNISER